MKKKIYIAYTGGTIGMKESDQGYVPVKGHLTQAIKSTPDFLRSEMHEIVINE